VILSLGETRKTFGARNNITQQYLLKETLKVMGE
jgi:hypothetical protein